MSSQSNIFTPNHLNVNSYKEECPIIIRSQTVALRATAEARPMSYSDGDVAKMSFERRMRDLALGRNSKTLRRSQKPKQSGRHPPNLLTVETLEDYKKIVGEEREKITVVRFFATWCKSCKAMAPGFYRLANLYPNVSFVQVPVSNKNSDLHQGLEVPSVPFGHIYHPNGGLVEEMKISKKYFATFESTVTMYVKGSCELNTTEEDIFTSPFVLPRKKDISEPSPIPQSTKDLKAIMLRARNERERKMNKKKDNFQSN